MQPLMGSQQQGALCCLLQAVDGSVCCPPCCCGNAGSCKRASLSTKTGQGRTITRRTDLWLGLRFSVPNFQMRGRS